MINSFYCLGFMNVQIYMIIKEKNPPRGIHSHQGSINLIKQAFIRNEEVLEPHKYGSYSLLNENTYF